MSQNQNPNLFSERVNAVSNIIISMSSDPAERLGIANAVCEIYKFELQKYFTAVPAPSNQNGTEKPVEAPKESLPE